MMDIYAMRRANGDWFAMEDDGRVRVPVFYSDHDALMARLRNFEMLLFLTDCAGCPFAQRDRLRRK